jgi:serine/threonine protein kinase
LSILNLYCFFVQPSQFACSHIPTHAAIQTWCLFPYFVPATSLSAIQARYNPSLAKRIYPLHLALDAAQGMAHLHTLGFLHRDLKSANLFCKGTAHTGLTVKVGDLGLSHRLKQVRRGFETCVCIIMGRTGLGGGD